MMDSSAIPGEYAGMSLQDVALAIGYAADEVERERATLAFLRLAGPPHPAGIGHNAPPLAELLDEELAPFRRRRDELVETAKTAAIKDEDSASKVLDLSALCKAFEDEVDARRKELIRPHREAEKLINDTHNRLRLDVQIARYGVDGVSGLRGLLTRWDDRKKADAEEARQKALREQRARESAAESARQKAAEAAATGQGTLNADLARMQAEEEAEKARAMAEAVQAQPTRGHLGQVSRKREIAFEITDGRALVNWLMEQPGLKGNLGQALKTIIGAHLRSLGIEAITRGVDIPGVAARIEQGGAIVRR